ncbi:unnamed protein product (macronuclear) [Paramecium tetraurelia]|uniref:Uncharacterized protein n=1 Tax=Paramecium tetraurelia TaxID=5888 RepID=A0BNU6_PARTE|nr:uncharacterized protein GSPATT00030852001 [Paramecium tetraurelia]CAK60213.1 unnamed protein product [Paramecium tetraurelia]|eukprot:XP_001427611.1 hypothetical protein (macronuclear) [Paramecium tetraurelia strain d4-2]
MDRFEEDFFQQSFNFELQNETLQFAEISSENLCLRASSENNSIEICKNSQMESIIECQSQVVAENYSNYRKNEQSQLQKTNKKSNFFISPLKGIQKCLNPMSLYSKKVRFRSSDKMTGKRKPKKYENTAIRNQKNKYF